MQADFAHCWRMDDTADVKLTLHLTGAANHPEWPLHSFVLIHFSKYFCRLMTSGVGSHKRKDMQDGWRYTLSEEFASSDETAVRATLDCMYNQPLSNDISAMTDNTLVNIMRVRNIMHELRQAKPVTTKHSKNQI